MFKPETAPWCKFSLEMAEITGDSTAIGGAFEVRIPREMADSDSVAFYTTMSSAGCRL